MYFEFFIASICAAILILIWVIRCNIVSCDDQSLIITHGGRRGIRMRTTSRAHPQPTRSRQQVLQMDAVINNIVCSKRNGQAENGCGSGGSGGGDSTGIKRPEGQDCPICLSGGEEDNKDGDVDESNTWVALNGCKHWFHSACIYAWLERHETCPLCREPYEMVVYM